MSSRSGLSRRYVEFVVREVREYEWVLFEVAHREFDFHAFVVVCEQPEQVLQLVRSVLLLLIDFRFEVPLPLAAHAALLVLEKKIAELQVVLHGGGLPRVQEARYSAGARVAFGGGPAVGAQRVQNRVNVDGLQIQLQ